MTFFLPAAETVEANGANKPSTNTRLAKSADNLRFIRSSSYENM